VKVFVMSCKEVFGSKAGRSSSIPYVVWLKNLGESLRNQVVNSLI
jgi:hypothetical protein